MNHAIFLQVGVSMQGEDVLEVYLGLFFCKVFSLFYLKCFSLAIVACGLPTGRICEALFSVKLFWNYMYKCQTNKTN